MGVIEGANVVVVVVTFEAYDELAACLDSLDTYGVGVAHTVVVDNGGAAPIRSSATITTLRPSVNGGFAGGANIGFAEAQRLEADVVVLLNDDLTVTRNWLAPLVSELVADPEVGAVQPMLLLAGSSPPTVNSLGVTLGRDGAGHDIALGEFVDSIAAVPRTIDLFTGGAVAFRRAFLEQTAGFDERYFLYYEDVDLARRGSRLGWRYRCVPASTVMHAKGRSTDAMGDRVVYLRERNRLWSAFRNEAPRTVVGALWLSVRRLRHRPYTTHLCALIAGIAGGVPRLAERARGHR